MPRWTSIDRHDLKAAGHGSLVDRAGTVAVGGTDPVADAIASAVARVRRAVAAANALDTDESKVPLSLKDVTVRLVLWVLSERIGLELTQDQRDTKKNDQSDLNRIADRKILVEPADDPDATLTPQNRGNWNSENKLVMRTHPVPRPGVQQTGTDRYAHDDAPEDAQ